MSAGREDMDVRMLGNGRPFLVEIQNAKKFYGVDAAALQIQINESLVVKVDQCHFVKDSAAQVIKEGEESKEKVYRSPLLALGALCTVLKSFPRSWSSVLQILRV